MYGLRLKSSNFDTLTGQTTLQSIRVQSARHTS